MNLAAFYDEVFEVLGAADIGLVVPEDGPGVYASVPAPYIELPDVTYGEAGPGLHRVTDLGLVIIFGPANNSKVFRSALEYVSTEGPKSIQAALQAHDWVSVGTVYVRSAEPGMETIRGGNPQISYRFHIDVTGG